MLLPLILVVVAFVAGLMWSRRRKRRARLAQIQQLRQWLSQRSQEDPLWHQWINGLSMQEAGILLDLLRGFCVSLNWELDWLFTPEIEKAPALKQAMEEDILGYGRALLTALQMEQDVAAFQTYRTFARKPSARKQRSLIQGLYPRLAEASLLSTGQQVGRKLGRTPKRSQQISAVTQAFERNPGQAMDVLKKLLIDDPTISE